MTSTSWEYNTEFPVNNALDIEQDYNGYLWIASYEGLIRFDGVDFKVFRNNMGGYPSDTARIILKGKDKKLWIGTNGDGIVLMDNYRFSIFGKESGLPDLSVRALSFDSAGNLWVGTTKGILYVPSADFSSPDKKTFLDNNIINSIYSDNDGNLYAVTNEGEIYLFRNSNFTRYSTDNDSQYTSVFIDSKNRKWCGTVSGRILQDNGNNIIPIECRGIFSVKGFIETSDNTVWFWSEGESDITMNLQGISV